MGRVGAVPGASDALEGALAPGALVGSLGCDFEHRRRLRVNGRVTSVDQSGFRIAVNQSYGNCDMYIQTQHPKTVSFSRDPAVVADKLDPAQTKLVSDADTLFIASGLAPEGDGAEGFDVSHRGARSGFVLVAHETELLIPDYAGNNMFNTLGNLVREPRSGLLFIDFATGSLLQVSGAANSLGAVPCSAVQRRAACHSLRHRAHHPFARTTPAALVIQQLLARLRSSARARAGSRRGRPQGYGPISQTLDAANDPKRRARGLNRRLQAAGRGTSSCRPAQPGR
ncbi:MAG: pyridoxamine 5'-phosphate oxidase family protein [Myxococcota bacterium]